MSQPTTVTLTGTGVPHPAPGRAGAGVLVRYAGVALQFDAGRGTVIRLSEVGLEPHALTAQFVTHVHSDHVVDLADVAMTRWIQQQLHPCGPLVVVAPEGTAARYVRRMFDVFDDDIATRVAHVQPGPPEVELIEFPVDSDPLVVWSSDDGDVVVEAVAVHHEPAEAVAYRVTTPSAVVVVSGDTVVCDEVERFAAGADLLVHEACRTTALAEFIAGTRLETVFSYHADTVPLGGLAERAGVQHLLLTHLIPPPRSEEDEAAFVADVRSGGYTGRVTVGRDLLEVVLGRAADNTPASDATEELPDDWRAPFETVLDPHRATHLGIWRDEADDISREFYRWDVPALSAECNDAISAGTRADVVGLDLTNITDLLAPGYLPLETGIARTPTGALSVAVLTQWPGTAPELIDWWFGWHLASTERYKLWHPQAHYFSQPRFDLSGVPGLTDRQRYLENTSWVDEYISFLPSRLAITFHDPAEIGLDADALEASRYGTVVCAVVTDSDHGHELSRLVHAVRRTDSGCEMRSRFIFGAEIPDLIGPLMLDHCWTEMTHLASFLPKLHERVTSPAKAH
jgi:ribonuclease Z